MPKPRLTHEHDDRSENLDEPPPPVPRDVEWEEIEAAASSTPRDGTEAA